MEDQIQKRTEAFRAVLGEAPNFGGIADLYAYEVEIDRKAEGESDFEIIEELTPADFQATEEHTNVMPPEQLVECRTAAATPAPVMLPPPLPPAEKLRAFRLGVRRALERADLEAMIPFVFAHGEAYPAEPKETP